MTEQERYLEQLTTVYSRDTVQVKIVRILNQDGTYKLRVHVESNGQLEPPLEFPMDELRTKILKIKNYSAHFSGIEIAEIISKIQKATQADKVAVIEGFHGLGWQIRNGEITGWKSAVSFDLHGTPLPKDIYAPYPVSGGNLEDNINTLKAYISNHGVVAQATLLYGFSAVLAGYLGKCLLLNVSGKSSRGKTTLARLIVSLFAHPEYEKLNTTFNVTLNKMSERLDGLYGTAVLIDDLSLAPTSVRREIDNMTYVLESGREKERLKTKSFSREPARWATTIIFSAEESILGLCDPEKEGVVGRLMELSISADDLFKDAQDATSISDACKKDYGLLADEFVRRLIVQNKLKELRERYEQKQIEVRADYSGVMARMAENVALVILCGELLHELFSFSFCLDDIQKYLLSTEQDNLDNFRMAQRDSIILSKLYPALLEYGAKVCPDENKNHPGRIVISSKFMKEMYTDIQKQYGYKPRQVKQALKDAGVLYANDGPYSYSGTINGKSFRGIYLYTQSKRGEQGE